MATFNNTATERRANLLHATASGPAHSVKVLCSTVELAASATGQTIGFGRIPTSARILGASRLYNDDLATAGSPTLDIGLAEVKGNLANANDPDAIGNGHDLANAANDVFAANSNISNLGLPAWDLVASESSDPGGELEVYGTVVDAVTTATGTITLELFYYMD